MRILSLLSVLFVLGISLNSGNALAAPKKYYELSSLSDPALQAVLEASQELKQKLGTDPEDPEETYRNTSLVMAVRAADTHVFALRRAVHELQDGTLMVGETYLDAQSLYREVTRDLLNDGEDLSDLEARINLRDLRRRLIALEESAAQGEFEVYTLFFDDWQAHTGLYAVAIYDPKNKEGLLIGFTELSW